MWSCCLYGDDVVMMVGRVDCLVGGRICEGKRDD